MRSLVHQFFVPHNTLSRVLYKTVWKKPIFPHSFYKTWLEDVTIRKMHNITLN